MPVRFADDCFGVRIRVQHQDSVNLLARALLFRHDGRFAHARDRIQYALHVLRDKRSTRRRNDHLFLAAENFEALLGIQFADVAGVQPAFWIPRWLPSPK